MPHSPTRAMRQARPVQVTEMSLRGEARPCTCVAEVHNILRTRMFYTLR